MDRSSGAASASVSGPNATVASIEVLPGKGMASATEGGTSDAVGSSGGSGATGSSGDAQSYRITVRMDDGSTQVVLQDTAPGIRTGDRVNLSGGVLRQ